MSDTIEQTEQREPTEAEVLEGMMPSFPMFAPERTTRKISVELPPVDNLGIQTDAPTIEVEAESDGAHLTIKVRCEGMARNTQEYDALIHLMASSI